MKHLKSRRSVWFWVVAVVLCISALTGVMIIALGMITEPEPEIVGLVAMIGVMGGPCFLGGALVVRRGVVRYIQMRGRSIATTGTVIKVSETTGETWEEVIEEMEEKEEIMETEVQCTARIQFVTEEGQQVQVDKKFGRSKGNFQRYNVGTTHEVHYYPGRTTEVWVNPRIGWRMREQSFFFLMVFLGVGLGVIGAGLVAMPFLLIVFEGS